MTQPQGSAVAACGRPDDARPPRRLLIVDDDDAVRRVTSEMLSVLGYDVEAVSSGPRALARLEQDHFDLMLLDLAMPTMSGAEVITALGERGVTLPVILMTGFAPADVDGLLEGSNPPRGVLSKPFPMNELRETLERACSMDDSNRP